MKKQLLFLFFALLALCASAAPNDVFSVGDITYSVTLDSYSGKPGIVAVKSLSAQGKAKTSLKLDIPGVVSYNGYKYKVGVINYDAFKGQSNISVVQIRYNITRIAQSAFENCTSLTTVYMPSSLINVGYRAFGGCRALKSVYFANATPSSTSVVPNSFPWNSGMTLYVSKAHPNSVENARKVTAFDYFSTIKKHEYACDFILSDHGYFCVTKAPLSDGSTRGEMSFVGVYADNNLNNSWSGAYNNGILDFDVVEIADSACLGNTGIKSVNFTGYSKLRRVGKSAFSGCTALSSVTLGMNVLEIRAYAFKNCTSLKSITLPASVRECSAYFVDGCSNLQTISVNGNNNYFASYAGILYNKAKTELIRCPEGYKRITMMHHDIFPAALKTIGPYAFENCKLIEEIYLPYGTTTIGRAAFNKCSALTTIQTPATLTAIGDYAFSGTTALSKFFANNTNPVSVSSDAFNDSKRTRLYCKRPTGYRAAKGWNTWKSVVFGGFDIMGEKDDSNTALRFSIHSNKPETVHGKAFDGRVTLTYMPPESSQNNEIRIPDEVVCRNGKKYAVTLIGSMVAPDISKLYTLYLGTHIDTIGAGAFARDNSIKGLVSTINLKCIQTEAFSEARNLKGYIRFHYGLKVVDSKAFYDTRVEGLQIPTSITSFANDAIAQCTGLQWLIFGGTDAKFYTSTDWDFSGIDNNLPLYVARGYGKKFEANEKWKKFQVINRGAADFSRAAPETYYAMAVTSDKPFTKNGVAYDGEAKYVLKHTYFYWLSSPYESGGIFKARLYEEDVDSVGNKKRYLMTELGPDLLINGEDRIKTVDLDDMKYLRSIDYGAFYGTGITKINIPSACSYIGNRAFYNCKNLSEVLIGSDNTCKLGGQPFGNNASDFKFYVKSNTFSEYKKRINNIIANNNWAFTEGDNITPHERLRPYFRQNSDSAISFSVDYPVDWKASGLNAYVVRDYDKDRKMAYTQKVTSTYAGTGLLVTDYDLGRVYKLQAPTGSPTTYPNLLVGSSEGPVEVSGNQGGYLFDSYYKYFWKPTSSYRLRAGDAYLKLSPTEAGSTTKINIDLWANATGDINGDGEVNVSDVTALINKILGSSTYSDAVCDINGDGEINVSDVTALINLILK